LGHVIRTINQTALDDHERAAIRAAARLLRERFAALEVVLFGSRARGEGDAESDLDLLMRRSSGTGGVSRNLPGS